jgi:hypothetical protein
MPNNEKLKVTVKGDGMSFERDVPREIGEQIVVFAITGQFAAVKSEGATRAEDQTLGSQIESVAPEPEEQVKETVSRKSIREFFNEVNPPRNIDRIAAIGRYLQKYHGQTSFTYDDLIGWFEAAREKVPANLPRDIAWAIRAGWIAESHSEEDTYYLTGSGESVVDDHFPQEALDKTRQARKGRKSNTAAQVGSD